MALTKYKLGELIEFCDSRNTDGLFSESDVRGISNTKELMSTKADLLNRSLEDFKIVYPNEFVYNRRTTRMGDKLAITLNNTDKAVILTNDYIVFKVVKKDILLNEYLFMFFNRPEFDRYSRYNSWGSATEMFVWESICDVDITLPSIEEQRKYVDVYLSLKNNLSAYQSKVDELKQVCDGYLDKMKKECGKKALKNYIELFDIRNENGELGLDKLRGISTDKVFINTKADMLDVSLNNYKVINPNDFVYVADTSRRGDKIALAFNDSNEKYIVSSIYTSFRVKDENSLDPHFLKMFYTRTEFDRYTRFNSWGSARETFEWDDMCDVKIPIPPIKKQRAISAIYRIYVERQRIATQLKEQLNNLCPILIKGSLQNLN